MKKKLLVVLPESPYPPRKNGLALRYYPMLLRLSHRFDLTLACVVDNEDCGFGDLSNCVSEIICLRKSSSPPSMVKKVAAQVRRFLPFGIPFSYYDYGASYIASQLEPIFERKFYSVLWVAVGHLLDLCLPHLAKDRLIIDAIDSASLHLQRHTQHPRFWDALSLRKTQRWEASLIDRADVGFYISPVDRDAIRSRLRKARLEVSPNGTLIEDYTAERADLKSPSLGFLGNMSYGPNIDAVHRLYRIYAALKSQVPNLSLYVIGRDPDPSLMKYAQDPDVHITGTLENIWPFVNAVDIFVMPMAQGAGQQNKLLEVMYAGRAIVASSVANGGVLAVDGESLLLADSEPELQKKVLDLLQNAERRERIAAAGARFVRATYDWDVIAARFADVIEGVA